MQRVPFPPLHRPAFPMRPGGAPGGPASRFGFGILLAAAFVPAACVPEVDPWNAQMEVRAETITAEGLMEHISVLASDEFEGRAPGTRGEDLTVGYLVDRFEAMGLQPGNPDGTYIQSVPLIAYTPVPRGAFHVGDETIQPSHPDEYVARSRHFEPEVSLEGSELLFVGYGVQAPEFDWDDFKGADLTGKTLLVLVNDPPVPHPDDPDRLDPDVFRGEAMTYYGRWTYKYEVAAELGAEAVVVIHETGPAGYPFDVISGAFGGEGFDVPAEDPGARLAVEAWVDEPTARRIFSAAGHDFDELKAAAARRDFQPVPFDGTFDVTIETAMRRIESRNVIARVPGSDPARRDEHVIYTAHWDHFGVDEEGNVFNGAVDNASGTGSLLEVARAFAELEVPPARSILFLAVTAEENGLLGSKWYAENPLYPLETTLAAINMDTMNPWGPTHDVEVIGYGSSTLEGILEEEAARQGRHVRPDASPELGYFYRSDHFEFVKQGVPALYTSGGIEYLDRPEGWGEERWARWTADDYHAVSDTVGDDWDLRGMAQDAQLLFRVGYRVARAAEWPEWYEGTEFRQVREDALAGAGG
jgi:Zn-dependent M28 family amino/carboxypeptidase